MLGEPSVNWQTRRRTATREAIVEAAWEVARRRGLAALTLREVAAEVGMRAPSLYTHFDSKNSIYDAMFGQAWRAYEAVVDREEPLLPAAPRAACRRIARVFVDFAVADLPRYQLMNQRIIADFAPSEESYAPAVRVIARFRAAVEARTGPLSDEAVDLFVALVGGLCDAQWANDPGGDRYTRLVDRAVDMYADALGLPEKET